MGALQTLGSTAATEQGKRKRWQRGGSEDQLWTYRGPTAAVESLYEAFKASALVDPKIAVLDYDAGRGLGSLTVAYADDQAALGVSNANGITTLYELIPNEFSKRPELAPYFQGNPSITIDEIINAYKAYNAGASTTDAEGPQHNLAEFSLDLFKILSSGVEEYLESAYVLRETKVVSGKNAVRANFSDINRVSTPPSNAAANTLIGDLSDRQGEWLKKAPAVRQISRTKWSVVTEWWWAWKWSATLYGGSLAP